jgi:glycosyltransferase involved in cell wall biosynthesis
MTHPLVSVIIPAYNSIATIHRSLTSVLGQSLNDFEVIVVDDGSTDATLEAIKGIVDIRVKYFRQSNQGVSSARNKGIANASGRFIAFLDADDYWLPDKLEKQVALLNSQPEIGMVYSKSYVVDEEERQLCTIGRIFDKTSKPSEIFSQLLLGNFIPSPTPMIREHCVREVGFFDDMLHQSEDWDYWLRITKQFPIAGITESLACYKITRNNLLEKMSTRGAQSSWINIIDKHRYSGACNPQVLKLASAIAWFKGAVVDIGLGNISEGSYRLKTALEIEPKLFIDNQKIIIDIVTSLAVQLCGSQRSSNEGERLLNSLWEAFPKTKQTDLLRRKALGIFYASRYFQGHASDNIILILYSLWPMIHNRPEWLLNRGVWSIALRALKNISYSDFFRIDSDR